MGNYAIKKAPGTIPLVMLPFLIFRRFFVKTERPRVFSGRSTASARNKTKRAMTLMERTVDFLWFFIGLWTGAAVGVGVMCLLFGLSKSRANGEKKRPPL